MNSICCIKDSYSEGDTIYISCSVTYNNGVKTDNFSTTISVNSNTDLSTIQSFIRQKITDVLSSRGYNIVYSNLIIVNNIS